MHTRSSTKSPNTRMISLYQFVLTGFLLAVSAYARIPLSRTPQLTVSPRHLASSYQVKASPNSLFGVLRVRGGDVSDEESDSEEDSEEITLSDDDKSDADEAVSDEDEAEEETKPELSIGPVKLTIKTNLNCPVSDQTLEFTASGKRTVESLKQGTSICFILLCDCTRLYLFVQCRAVLLRWMAVNMMLA